MGAREELLAAAHRLRSEGQPTFSPVQLIGAAREAGSAYPDSTLRTFINGPMCQNSPDHHAVQYGDLVRIGHGQYRLASATDAADSGSGSPVTAAPPAELSPPPLAAPPNESSADWRWEGNVQAAVVKHLAVEGWSIRRVADTLSRERGIDIEATQDGMELLVEVKGYPSDTFARGPKAGEPKPTGSALQARHYFAGALLSGSIIRSERPHARVALAFPDVSTYSTLGSRVAPVLTAAGIELWLVAVDGTILETRHAAGDNV